jgi:hypothetical protein
VTTPLKRLRGDFNGVFGDVLCLSHTDTCQDEDGATVELATLAGTVVTAFDEDCDDAGAPDDLIATGTVVPSPDWLQCKGSRWSLQIDENGVRHQSDVRDLTVNGLRGHALFMSLRVDITGSEQ